MATDMEPRAPDRPVMYAAHFGLREAPFAITPDPRYLYMSERHREALAHLLYGVGEGGGFVQLTGEVGTGKTTVCRCLLEQLPPRVDVALVLNPRLTSVELMATVCDELGVAYPAGTPSLKVLVDALDRHLLAAHGQGRRTVLVIDEAQDLAEDVLEQVRLLTNLETRTAKLLQIILIGQPELGRLLAEPRLRQLAQRITARYHLTPLGRRETASYVRHRLAVAGGSRALFTEGALAVLHRRSGGVPRLINAICDRALLGAYTGNLSQVDARTVRRATAEVLGAPAAPRGFRRWGWRGAGVALAGAACAALLMLAGPARLARLVPGLGPRTVPVPRVTAPPVAGELGSASPVSAPAAVPALAGSPAMPTVTAALVAPPRAAEAATDPGLADLLGSAMGPGGSGDQAAALLAVHRRWHPEGPPPGPPRCEEGRMGTLGCAPGKGTWRRLRRLNVPVVLELVGASGERRHAALVGLQGSDVMLEVEGRTLRAAVADVDRFWDGRFWLLWPRPAFFLPPLGPGVRGPGVAWLRQRLDVVTPRAGDPVAASSGAGAASDDDPMLYDEALRSRVVAFQRARGLVPDGLAGMDTIAQVAAAAREPGVPWLVRP